MTSAELRTCPTTSYGRSPWGLRPYDASEMVLLVVMVVLVVVLDQAGKPSPFAANSSR